MACRDRKGQLTRVLAKELGYELFEVASEDSEGDPVNGERRLRALRAVQGTPAPGAGGV